SIRAHVLSDSFVYLRGLLSFPTRRSSDLVDVVAHRWWWEFRYPKLGDDARTMNEIHVPAGVPVHLRLMSSDVIHAFWVPRVAGKDRKSTRLNSSHVKISYAVFCLKKKKKR